MELPLPIFTLGAIRPEYSGTLFCVNKHTCLDVWICLGVNPLDMPRRKTLSITHHALSPHPHIIICTSFIHQRTTLFFLLITMSLKMTISAER